MADVSKLRGRWMVSARTYGAADLVHHRWPLDFAVNLLRHVPGIEPRRPDHVPDRRKIGLLYRLVIRRHRLRSFADSTWPIAHSVVPTLWRRCAKKPMEIWRHVPVRRFRRYRRVMAAPRSTTIDRNRSGRERVLAAAYDLFSQSGVRAIGVDTIIAEADVAKTTLYRNFGSKNALALAFLALREERWTKQWVEAEVLRRADTPAEQLLTIFEIFSEWFAREDFEGCAFITSLLEFEDHADPVRQACVMHLANIRGFIRELATAAGVSDPEHFAGQWHILMKGSIVAAHEGDTTAAQKAREMGLLLLAREGVELRA